MGKFYVKKKRIVAFIVVILAFTYFYLPTGNFVDSTVNGKKSAFSVDEIASKDVFPFSSRNFATNKLKQLTLANEQCKENQKDFSANVQSILGILISTLEHELRNGKSVRDLLAYDHQFKTYYSSYDDLLLKARLNIEREKYRFTDSVEILNHWSGLSVINGFSPVNIPLIVEATELLGGSNNHFNIPLELKADISESDVLELLENTDNFNTYLESTFTIDNVPLSPSTLFVLSATRLEIDEYQQVVSLKTFTVNDIAVALNSGMPIDYLKLLVEQVEYIENMPTVIQGRYETYENLADLAAATHNVDMLKLLKSYGVRPTNEPGIVTGLDLAIINLPKDKSDYSDLSTFPDKYLHTIKYLISEGYMAHGWVNSDEEHEMVYFRAPYGRSFNSEFALSPELQEALLSIELLDSSYGIPQISNDSSLVSTAIETIEIKKSALNESLESCQSIAKALQDEEGFADKNDVFSQIEQLTKEGNVAQNLHRIDPALVNLWRQTANATYTNSQSRDSDFISWLHEKNYQQALNYSATKPLTENETNQLLSALVLNTEDILPIWQARATETPPSGLLVFTRLSLEQWQFLINEGFDFSALDKWGGDFFRAAGLHSSEAVQLLLDKGFSPNLDNLGLDAIDLLLEDSYDKGRLNPSLELILNDVDKLEPSHFSRIARLQKFFPAEYQKLINLNEKYIPPTGTELNRYKLTLY